MSSQEFLTGFKLLICLSCRVLIKEIIWSPLQHPLLHKSSRNKTCLSVKYWSRPRKVSIISHKDDDLCSDSFIVSQYSANMQCFFISADFLLTWDFLVSTEDDHTDFHIHSTRDPEIEQVSQKQLCDCFPG